MIPSALASQLRNGLFDFLRYSFWSSTPGFENAVEELISRSGAVNKGPYVSMKLPFVSGTRPDFFPDIPLGFLPHAHQERAFERLGPERKRSTLVATGTGSGKTESFLIPILRHCLSEVSVRGIKAILIYPMNALATDQAGRIARMIHDNPKLRGLVTAGLFIGESKGKRGPGEAQMARDHIITDREVLKSSPPDILLTNYKMLDYLLLRSIDQKIWQHNARGVLRFLVVDELHTFDGAQGTDLACLIRRLKRRLGADDGELCCVGTSATLGGSEAKERLLDYAGQVFGEGFDDEAIIGESRLTAEGFLSGFEMAHTEKPTADDLPLLEWDGATQPGQWLRNQERLWFGDELSHGDDIERRVALGERLRRHAAVRSLVGLLDGRVLSLSDIIAHLAQRDSSWRANERLAEASMVSLLALISSARRWIAEVPELQREREAAGGPRPHRPLVEMRIQLWQREMRRMVSSVSSSPRLEFSDDLDREARRSHLPAVHCRDCGAMGWATVIDLDKKSSFHCDLASFYRAFFRKDPHVRFVYPASAAPHGDPLWDARPRILLDTKTLSMIDPDDTPKGEALPVVVVASSRRTDSGPQLSRDCPFCSARESLTLVGFRAATLTSVFVDQVFASLFNDGRDKKLLTFSDSVQDAAHRAGFFGARTWRTSLRVALRRSLTEMESPTLADLQREFPRYWRTRLPEETFVSTFIAPNMEWLHDWDTLTREGRLPPGSDLLTLIEKRLAFEVASELGLDAGIGRSLIRTRSAAVFVDPQKLQTAVARLLEPLQNEVPGLRGLTADHLRAFLLGFLHHLRMRGGIDHPQLPRRFVESAGSDAYVFYQTHYLPAFGATSRLPALLTDIPGSRHFDTWTGARRGGSGWYERYLGRALKAGALGPDAASFYPLALRLLCDVGLLRVTEAPKGGKIWGASCDAFRVTTNAVQVRCNVCDHRVTVAGHEADEFLAAACLTGRCEGHYSPVPSDAPDFFGQLYAEGDLERIFTAEHTGLLSRTEREKVERQFKAVTAQSSSDDKGRKPWFPNLLSCTPTLEMGIDIGDLSSTFLCSVPPSQASFLQRIGRAGRRDGNSFVLTVSGARPHDLYFYAQPEEMMEGDVLPPGVFLDASAVLERQLTAYCFDRWVATRGEEADLPATLSKVFSHMGERRGGGFPYSFTNFVGDHCSMLLREFSQMFAGTMTPATEAHLEAFLLGDETQQAELGWRLLDALEREHKQRKSLGEKARTIAKEIDKLKAQVARSLNFEDRLRKLEEESEALTALVKAVDGRQTLEFLTGEGLLPNYAFPESSVRLSSVIWRKKKKAPQKGSKYDTWTYEYARSPGSALAELAPGADFYAGGRRVTVDQVDVSVTEVEHWRFCDNCNHAQRLGLGAEPTSCPACGSKKFIDTQRRMHLLPLRQVFANAPDKNSRIRDDRDERQPRFFHRQVLVEFREEESQGAWHIDEKKLPFGFEFLRRATFRELNFGEYTEDGKKTHVAGTEAVRPGFKICTRCGKVQTKNDEPQHALSCPVIVKKFTPHFEPCLYLYREFSSEALRILLPVADVGTKKRKHSFMAALMLGLRLRFGGSVDHLHLTEYSEPQPGSALRRSYLVIFDSVPGGTGYVKQLVTQMEDDGRMALFEAMEMAKERISTCSCRSKPGADGCYRCLLAYRNAKNMDDTSASEAIAVLGEILVREDKLRKTKTLSNISVSGLMDSVLEARFLEALRHLKSADGRPARVKNVIRNHKSGYYIEIGPNGWWIEPQVELGGGAGLGMTISIDFVLECDDTHPGGGAEKPEKGPRKIAVFLDGWEFHKDRIGKDLLQRQILMASGRFDVWSFTWRDLDEVLTRAKGRYKNLFYDDPRAIKRILSEGGLPNDLFEQPLLEVFGDALAQPRSADWWSKIAKVIVAQRMAECPKHHDSWKELVRSLPGRVRDVIPETRAGFAFVDESKRREWLTDAVHFENGVPTCLEILDDRLENRDAQEFQETWNGYLRLFQFLRFDDRAWFLTRSSLDELDFGPLVRLRFAQPPAGWAQDEIIEESFKALCLELEAAGVGEPEIGMEIEVDDGRIWAEAELLWDEPKVAVTDRARFDDAQGKPPKDWTIFVLEDIETAESILKALEK